MTDLKIIIQIDIKNIILFLKINNKITIIINSIEIINLIICILLFFINIIEENNII